MKNQTITKYAGNIHDPVIEEMIQKRDVKLKESTLKNAKHFAKRNLPAPEGDKLEHFTADTKAGYEKLASDIYYHLQPSAHFPDAFEAHRRSASAARAVARAAVAVLRHSSARRAGGRHRRICGRTVLFWRSVRRLRLPV